MTNEQQNRITMNKLNKVENVVFLLGGLMMVVGSGAAVFFQSWAPYLFAMGALCFCLMQFKQRYEGNNFVIQRLSRMMLLSDVLFLLTAFLMFADRFSLFRLLNVDYLVYVQYVYNNWVVVLLVAAMLQLYSMHRIGAELDKEAKKR